MEDPGRVYMLEVVQMLDLVPPDHDPVPFVNLFPEYHYQYIYTLIDEVGPLFLQTVAQRVCEMAEYVQTTFEEMVSWLQKAGWDGYANFSPLPRPGTLSPRIKPGVPRAWSGQARGPPQKRARGSPDQ